MELPPPLQQAVDRLLEGTPLGDIRAAAKTLSDRYRAETRDGRLHMAGDLAVKAYLAARLPATYAAVRAALEAVQEARPDFAPRSLTDVGAGPGTVLWAAADLWNALRQANLIEASGPVRKAGEALATSLAGPEISWLSADVTIELPELAPADLVTAAYVLDEIAPASATKLIDQMWSLTADTLLIVEPGTPAGWQRILRARSQLIAAGAHLLAPCPHERPCPLAPPDWCHFSRRVARSRLHRLTKDADVPWEDEKFIYVAASRGTLAPLSARVLAPPKAGSGKVALKLCQPDGIAAERLFTRRDAQAFKRARRVDWGDTFAD